MRVSDGIRTPPPLRGERRCTAPPHRRRYANNQWNLASELVDDLAQTSFRKALTLAGGYTLSVVDPEGITYTRALRRDSNEALLCVRAHASCPPPRVPLIGPRWCCCRRLVLFRDQRGAGGRWRAGV